MSDSYVYTRVSGLMPLAMSLGALAVVVLHIVFFGAGHEADEGAAAHIFQLLIAAQLPIIAFFLFRWLPRYGVQALKVFTVQLLGIAVALAPVWYFHL